MFTACCSCRCQEAKAFSGVFVFVFPVVFGFPKRFLLKLGPSIVIPFYAGALTMW